MRRACTRALWAKIRRAKPRRLSSSAWPLRQRAGNRWPRPTSARWPACKIRPLRRCCTPRLREFARPCSTIPRARSRTTGACSSWMPTHSGRRERARAAVPSRHVSKSWPGIYLVKSRACSTTRGPEARTSISAAPDLRGDARSAAARDGGVQGGAASRARGRQALDKLIELLLSSSSTGKSCSRLHQGPTSSTTPRRRRRCSRDRRVYERELATGRSAIETYQRILEIDPEDEPRSRGSTCSYSADRQLGGAAHRARARGRARERLRTRRSRFRYRIARAFETSAWTTPTARSRCTARSSKPMPDHEADAGRARTHDQRQGAGAAAARARAESTAPHARVAQARRRARGAGRARGGSGAQGRAACTGSPSCTRFISTAARRVRRVRACSLAVDNAERGYLGSARAAGRDGSRCGRR